MLYQPEKATGERLKSIRIEAGFKAADAVKFCNEDAITNKSKARFNLKKLHRFEEIGLNTRYGTTPPNYEELNIMMRVYHGSLSYLVYGIPPKRHCDDLSSLLFDPWILEHITWLQGLPEDERTNLLKLMHAIRGSSTSTISI